MTDFQYLKKVHLNGINHIFMSNLPYIQCVLSIENSCHLHCHTKYIWSNVAATFVSNEHTVIIEQSTRYLKTLLQRCKNVRYYSLGILEKARLIRIFNIFVYNLPYIELIISIQTSCHLHFQARYIW